MLLTQGLKSLYAATIDRSKFRETASRIIVFALPLFYWGRSLQWWGLVLVALGVLIRAWGAGYLYKDSQMAQGGPYLLMRHPLYCGSCLISAGLIVTLHHWFVTLTIGGVTFLQYWHTIRHEEQNLKERFGEPYIEFCRSTPPIWPSITSLQNYFKNKSQSRFSWKQYLRNKEYELLLGVVVVLAVLYVGAHRN